MLCRLSVNNFTIVRSLELNFENGMTSITGETGAGKSIAIDAIGLCLGNRAEASMVRNGASKTEVCAQFSLSDVPNAQRWLEDNDLELDNECILRRTLNSEGRSRAYINGNVVPLNQLRTLGQLLIGIHSQHAHQSMLKSSHQLMLLDSYADHKLLLDAVGDGYREYHHAETRLKQLQQDQQQRLARKQLLRYQVDELDEFGLAEAEFEQIEAEHKRLANGTALVQTCQQMLSLLQENESANIEQLLNTTLNHSQILNGYDNALNGIGNMLNNALIQVQESSGELHSYLDDLELDPEHFNTIEQRLSKAIQLARKHHIAARDLYQCHQDLIIELGKLDADEQEIETITAQVDGYRQNFIAQAKKLSQSRQRYAKELGDKVTKSIKKLSMPNGKFIIEVKFDQQVMTSNGGDAVEFQVTTNQGHPLQPLHKVASGGELSRIGLGIQVITAKKVATPTLIFDEVDVGISGSTAAVVGKMLRDLGKSTQVLCVTHLPQVAGNGHQHMMVDKNTRAGQTETAMIPLDTDQRIAELARLLGGDTITSNTLANAKELLQVNA